MKQEFQCSLCYVFIAFFMQVLDFELQRQLVPYMKEMTPLPGIYDPDFIAANQDTRADHVIKGSKQNQLETIRQDIRTFKEQNHVCDLSDHLLA